MSNDPYDFITPEYAQEAMKQYSPNDPGEFIQLTPVAPEYPDLPELPDILTPEPSREVKIGAALQFAEELPGGDYAGLLGLQERLAPDADLDRLEEIYPELKRTWKASGRNTERWIEQNKVLADWIEDNYDRSRVVVKSEVPRWYTVAAQKALAVFEKAEALDELTGFSDAVMAMVPLGGMVPSLPGLGPSLTDKWGKFKETSRAASKRWNEAGDVRVSEAEESDLRGVAAFGDVIERGVNSLVLNIKSAKLAPTELQLEWARRNNDVARAQELERKVYEGHRDILKGRKKYGTPQDYGESQGFGLDVAQGIASQPVTVGSMAVGIATGAATRNARVGSAAAKVLSFASTSVLEFGGAWEEFSKLRTDPEPGAENGEAIDPFAAAIAAAISALASAGVEVWTLGGHMGRLKGLESAVAKGGTRAWLSKALVSPKYKRVFSDLAKNLVKSARDEAGEEAIQFDINYLANWLLRSYQVGLDGPEQNYDRGHAMEGRFESAYFGGLGGLFGVGGVSTATNLVSQSFEIRKAREAGAEVEGLLRLSEKGEARAAPKSFARLVEMTMDDGEGPIKSAYINPKRIEEFIKAQGEDPTAVMEEVLGEGGGKRFAAALASFADAPGLRATLEVSVEEYLEKLGGTQLARATMESTTLRPGSMTQEDMALFQNAIDGAAKAHYDTSANDSDSEADAGLWEGKYIGHLRGQMRAAGMKDGEIRANLALERAVIKTAVARYPEAAEGVFRNLYKQVQRARPIVRPASYDKIRAEWEGMSQEERKRAFFLDWNTGALSLRGMEAMERPTDRGMLAVFEIEGTKFFNDHHGHDALDGGLRVLAGVLAKHGIRDAGKVGGSVVAWVKDEAHARALSKAMSESIDSRIRIAYGISESKGSVKNTIEAASENIAAAKAMLGAAGKHGQRKGAPAAFMRGLRINDPDRGVEGLAEDDPKIVEAIALAAEETRGIAERMKAAPSLDGLEIATKDGSLSVGSTVLTPNHDRVFQENLKTAFEDTYFEVSGLLNETGWALARKLNPGAFVMSGDLRAFKEMNAAWGHLGTDALNQVFAEILNALGAGRFDTSHPHGDEYYAQFHDEKEMREFFKAVQDVSESILFEASGEDSSGRKAWVLQKGLSFAFGIHKDFDQADRVELAKAKAEQQKVSKPEVYYEADSFLRRRSEKNKEAKQRTRNTGVGSVDVQRLVRLRSEEEARRRKGEVFHQAAKLLSRADRAELGNLLRDLKSKEAKAAAHIAAVSMISVRPKAPKLGPKGEVFYDIMKATFPNAVDDSPSEQSDAEYLKWKNKQGPRPKPFGDDTFHEVDKYLGLADGKGVSGLREAWDLLTREFRVRTWDQVEPVLEVLRRVPGLEKLSPPQHIVEYQIELEAWRYQEEMGHDHWSSTDNPEALDGDYDDVDMSFNPDEIELYQGERGFINIVKRGNGRAFRVFLTDNADWSTFAHESAHGYLRMMAELAAHPEANEKLRQEWGTILKWLGAKSFGDLTNEQHERWAVAWEEYLREGRSPSVGLAGVFQSFRLWLNKIYQALGGTGVEIDDTIRGVFDRMLATDREIQLMKDAAGLDVPIFRTREQSGMSPSQWLAYRARLWRSHAASVMKAQRVIFDNQERELEAFRSDAYDAAEKQAGSEYDSLPEVSAWRALKYGEVKTDLGTVERVSSHAKMDRDKFVEIFGKEHPLLEELGKNRFKRGGLSPDIVAKVLGYKDAESMVEAVQARPERDEWVKGRAMELVAEKWPELDRVGADLKKAIGDGLHEETARKFLVGELNALRKKALTPDSKALKNAVATGRAEVQALSTPVEHVRKQAYNEALEDLAKNISPDKVLKKERQAGDRALKHAAKKEWVRAALAKQEQLHWHFVWQAHRDAAGVRDALLKQAKGLIKTDSRKRMGLAGPEYRDVTDTLMESLGFVDARPSNERRKNLSELVSVMNASGVGGGFDPGLIATIMKTPMPWQELTVGELYEVRRALLDISRAASEIRKMKVGIQRIERDVIANGLVSEASNSSWVKHNLKIPKDKDAATFSQKIHRLGNDADQRMLEPQEMAWWLGNKDMDSWWYKVFQRPFMEAKGKEAEILETRIKPIVDAFDLMPASVAKHFHDSFDGKKFFPRQTGDQITRRWEVLMLAPHRGNESSLERLTTGRNITVEEIDNALGELTADELRWIQGVQDQIETLWPLIREQEELEHGMAPPKIEALPYKILSKDGVEVIMRGGYMPAVYEYGSYAGDMQALNQVADVLNPAYITPGTSHAWTNERSRLAPDARISLNPNQIMAHLQAVAHDLAFRRPLRDAAMLLVRKDVREALDKNMGPAAHGIMMQWLRDVGHRPNEVAKHLGESGSALNKMRAGFSKAVLGYALRIVAADALVLLHAPIDNMIDHASIGAAIKDVGLDGLSLAGAKAQIERDGMSVVEFAYANSPVLKARRNHITEEFQQIIKSMLRKHNAASDLWHWYKDNAWVLHEKMDELISTILWTGAYNKNRAEFQDAGMGEAAASKRAMEAADLVVQRIMPSGHVVDMSAVRRSQSWISNFVVFFSFLSKMYQRYRNVAQPVVAAKSKKLALAALPKSSLLALALSVVEGPLAHLIMGHGPPDKGDRFKAWRDWLLIRTIMAGPDTVPLVGTGVHAVVSLATGEKFSVRVSPLLSIIQAAARAGQKSQKKEVDPMEVVFATAKALGLATGAPTDPLKAARYWAEFFAGTARERGIGGMISGTLYGEPPGEYAKETLPLLIERTLGSSGPGDSGGDSGGVDLPIDLGALGDVPLELEE